MNAKGPYLIIFTFFVLISGGQLFAESQKPLKDGQYYITDAENMVKVRKHLEEAGVDAQSEYFKCNPIAGKGTYPNLEVQYRSIQVFEKKLSRPIPLHIHICHWDTNVNEARTCKIRINGSHIRACKKARPHDPSCNDNTRNGFLETEQIVALGKITRAGNTLVLFAKSGRMYTLRTSSTIMNCEPLCDANIIAHQLFENPQNFELSYARPYDHLHNRPSQIPFHNWNPSTCRHSISNLEIYDRKNEKSLKHFEFSQIHKKKYRRSLNNGEIEALPATSVDQ